jgi:methyl-accepting chemotaxis protein
MPQSSSGRPSVERRLLFVLALIAAVAVGGVLAIVPYRLYQRDVRLAEVNAHRIGSLLHVMLGHELQQGTDIEDVADLVNRFQGIAALEIRLRQLPADELHPGQASGHGSSERHDTDLTYTAPPILDKDGHTWLASMHFDLAPMKRESVRLIIDLVIAVLLGSAAFSLAVFWLIRRALLQPLHEVTQRVERFAAGEEPGPLPEFESQELASLMDALSRARKS